jgi:arginase
VNISIILAPYDSGHFHGGCGQGPDALISGGLAEALKLAGHDVEVHDIGKVVEDEDEREIGTGFAVCNAVSGEVRIALDKQRFPIVLAGNCLTAAGAIAGAGADAIIWADQHGDLNTPETTTTGFLDGMALATVLGLCWRSMAGQIPGFKAVDPARCVLVNARDLDAAEKELLKTLPVIRTECPDWKAAAQRLKNDGAKRVHMHVNRYTTPGGPAPEQVRMAMCGLAGPLSIAGLTISAYDPAFDPKGDVPPLVGELVVDLLSTLEGK